MTFITILSSIVFMTIYITNTHLENSEKQLFQAMLTKGNTLVVNNSQALIEMVSDNSFSAIKNLVSATVINDKDIVYGIFMDTSMRPWAIASQISGKVSKTDNTILNDPLSQWAASLKQSGYREVNSTEMPAYSAIKNNMTIYEFSAPVFSASDEEYYEPFNQNTNSVAEQSLSRELLGTIRYGISTTQMETARTEAKAFSQHVMIVTLFILFLFSFFAIFFAFIATRHTAILISKPLADLSQSTVDIAQGNYDVPVVINSDNEIGLLSRNFDSMRIKIKGVLEQLLLSQEDLKEKNKRLEVTQSELKDLNLHLEDKVKERTDELTAVQKKLLETARAAGMAEIAINVLHNIGNVINSVNIANQDNYMLLKRSKISSLIKTNELINENCAHIGDYLSQDPKGRKIPYLLDKLAGVLNKENQMLLENTDRMMQSIGIIGNIISTQQKYARSNLFNEEFNLKSVIEESLHIQSISLNKHLIKVTTDFKPVPSISGDKSKLHQILTNLLVNAKYALLNNTIDNRFVDIKLFCEQDSIVLDIKDNGEGISRKLLTSIFQHGFTTKKNGHGFGLHSCANLIGEMGGSIEANSDGPRKGACFTIKLPVKASNKVR